MSTERNKKKRQHEKHKAQKVQPRKRRRHQAKREQGGHGGHSVGNGHARSKGWGMVLAALGVVFGDIGTSPLYALKECVGKHGVEPTAANVYGLLSLIFWALICVVTIKYLKFIMKADNKGEGGITALLGLVPERYRPHNKLAIVPILAIIGAGLLYGDGAITPAISVLSAIEGLEVATPFFKPHILKITTVVLVGLFVAQPLGTKWIGRAFGPIMVVWFLNLAVTGVLNIHHHPAVIYQMLNPWNAIMFFANNGIHGFFVLGLVVLAVTGGEALFADMGHFGREAVKFAWYGVLPCLVLNYMGQGALLIEHPEFRANPFFGMVPQQAVYIYFEVGIGTAATVIASQALISGAFSLTKQNIQLGYLARTPIKFTNPNEPGQIYIGRVNWPLLAACLALVWIFRESEKLAAAYGLAVTGTMAITSIIYYLVQKGRGDRRAVHKLIFFLMFDLSFFFACLKKFGEGGWVPVVMATAIVIPMLCFKQGRIWMARVMSKMSQPVNDFLANLTNTCEARVSGTGVFLTASSEGIPPVLTHHLGKVRSLHATVVIYTIAISDQVAKVNVKEEESSTQVTHLGKGFFRVIVQQGFMDDTPNAPDLLKVAAERYNREILAKQENEGTSLDLSKVDYFIGREQSLPMKGWRRPIGWVYSQQAATAPSADQNFCLDPDHVEDVGMRLDLASAADAEE